MKFFTLTTISILAALAAVPSFAQLKLPISLQLAKEFRTDVDAIETSLSSTEFNVGDVSKALEKEKGGLIIAINNSAAKVESMSTRVDEISRHFDALRTGGVAEDNPEQLEAFCSKGTLVDLSYASQDKLIDETYEAEAQVFERLKLRLKSVADEMFNANSGWKLADIEVPGDYGPDAAKAYIESQEQAQTKAHMARVAAHLRIENATTRAGWAASRIRGMWLVARDGLRKSRKPASENEAQAGNAQSACKNAVALLRERRELAGGGRTARQATGIVAHPGL